MMRVVELATTDLVPYENNPRNNTEAVDGVAESIEKFGFKVPIIITTDNKIVTGHTRLLAAQKLGLETVPCIVADDLSEKQIKAFRLADNKVSELSPWDFAKLEEELAALAEMPDEDGFPPIDMEDFGFDPGEEFEDDDYYDGKTEQSGDTANNEAIPNREPSDFKYREQYAVIVKCTNEKEQAEIYERLTNEGLECKVVAV